MFRNENDDWVCSRDERKGYEKSAEIRENL